MRNAYKSFALLCMGLAAVACMEEQFEDDKPNKTPIAENEIIFSASASVETGNKQTKTAYGDVDASDKTDGTGKTGTVQINWKHNDPIMIASPHTAGTTHAKYLVNLGDDATENTVAPTAVSLDRQGDVGLQWSGREEPYQFWAMYPSPDTFADVENPVSVDVENETIVMRGYLPVDKRYTTLPAANDGRYEFAPDMMYAYMVADNTYTYGSDETISLEFTSLVTAMQFELQTGSITANQSNSEIIVSQIVLFSAGNQKLAGDFTYKFDGAQNCSEGTSTYASVTFDNVNQNNKPNGLILTEGDVCDVTFFMLPSYKHTSGDLKLKVVYYYDNILQTKTATIGSQIQPTKKYHFKGVKLPNITKIDASSWFDVLDPEIEVAKVSLPVASNAFSYTYTGSDPQYYRQQVVTDDNTTTGIQKLWNMGIRGFEFRTSAKMTTSTQDGQTTTSYTLDEEQMIVGGNWVGTATFNGALESVYNLLQANPSETAVIIATYQSKGGDHLGGYNPLGYIKGLENTLDTFFENNCTGKKKEQVFAKLTTGSKVEDIKGRLVVIVRPGDEDYMRHERNDNDNNDKINYSISDLKLSSDWEPYVSLIPNWGTGQDQWDKRFSHTYLTEGAYTFSNSDYSDDDDSKTKFEATYLKGSISSLSGVTTAWPDKRTPYWEAKVNGNNSESAYIQCWERVIPSSGDVTISGTYKYLGFITRSQNIHYYWPESLTEKWTAVQSMIADSRKMEKKGLYINCLSGYFPVSALAGSQSPYIGSEAIDGTTYTINSTNAGNITNCAAILNYQLWTYLSNTSDYGPLGVVMLDYVGAEESDFPSNSLTYNPEGITSILASTASKALPGLILMENFKVKPSTGGDTNGGITDPSTKSYDAVYVDGGEAISFE